MGNEVVRYDNYMNNLKFKGFTQTDFDLLMALCARMRDLGEEKVDFDFDYIMELIQWDESQNLELFMQALQSMNEKLAGVTASVDISADESITFVLFTTFRRNRKKRTLTVSVNPEFKFVLNELSRNFTRFELAEYVRLDGRYAKQLYAQIRQRYRLKAHFWQPTVEEIRHVLSIPDTYTTKRIYTLILEPAVQTIKSCRGMSDLSLEVVRSKRRGRPVLGYRFEWTASDQIPGQTDLSDAMEAVQEYKRQKKATKRDKIHFELEHDYDYDALEEELLEKQKKNNRKKKETNNHEN